MAASLAVEQGLLERSGFSSRGAQAWLSHAGIFPDQGVESIMSLHWQVASLPLSHQESPKTCKFLTQACGPGEGQELDYFSHGSLGLSDRLFHSGHGEGHLPVTGVMSKFKLPSETVSWLDPCWAFGPMRFLAVSPSITCFLNLTSFFYYFYLSSRCKLKKRQKQYCVFLWTSIKFAYYFSLIHFFSFLP